MTRDNGEKASQYNTLPIVAIGGSAGSLEPLNTFFENLPADTGAAFIVVTHQSTDCKPMLVDILAKATPMGIELAKHGVELLPNHVYISEPGVLLYMVEDHIEVIPASSQSSSAPIDVFLNSLAVNNRHSVIAIILSGMRSDGALGAMAVKDSGGIVMAQSPASSEFQSMPKAAIEKGSVDHVLPPSELAAQVKKHLKTIQETEIFPDTSAALASGNHSEPMSSIYDQLFRRTGCDFSLYKTGTVSRRIARRIAVHSLSSVEDYLTFINENPGELENLFRELLIEVTSFFRDPEVFDVLKQDVLPELIENKAAGDSIRIWVPACSTGEEAYSLAIVMRECLDEMGANVPVMIFATDINDYTIDLARRAMYPEGIAQHVSKERLQKYFVHKGDYFQVNSTIREQVVFAKQNLINDPPFTKLDIVSCRNLLIYLNGETQQRMIRQFHFSLNPTGVLILGSSESVSNQERLFKALNAKRKIFQRRDAVSSYEAMIGFGVVASSLNRSTSQPLDLLTGSRPLRVDRLVSEILLSRHAPPSALVNREGQFLFLHGRTGEFLEPPEGHPNMTLFEMAKPGLKAVLPGLFEQAETSAQKSVIQEVSIKSQAEFKKLQVSVTTFEEPEVLQGLFLVSFIKFEKHAQSPSESELVIETEGSSDISEMRMELVKAKESLQLAMQQKNWALQDLQASNEELQATNEELQSTNEELETSREELQSMNEELTTINAELERRVTQLYHANDDMQNLLNSIEVATIFLDNNLNVKRFNNQVQKIVHLRESDIGRPLSEITTRLMFKHLIDEVEQVLSTLVPYESEVRTSDQQYYLLRIQAYRTAKNVIDGVVITFVNIDWIKQLDSRQDSSSFFGDIMDTVQQPLIVLDLDCHVVACNEGFRALFGGIENEQVLIHEMHGGAWSDPEFVRALQDIIIKKKGVQALPFTVHTLGNGKQVVANIQRIAAPGSDEPQILIALQEASDDQ